MVLFGLNTFKHVCLIKCSLSGLSSFTPSAFNQLHSSERPPSPNTGHPAREPELHSFRPCVGSGNAWASFQRALQHRVDAEIGDCCQQSLAQKKHCCKQWDQVAGGLSLFLLTSPNHQQQETSSNIVKRFEELSSFLGGTAVAVPVSTAGLSWRPFRSQITKCRCSEHPRPWMWGVCVCLDGI